MTPQATMLVFNAGSSSLKFALCAFSEPLRKILWGELAGIGSPHAEFVLHDPHDARTAPASAADHTEAFKTIVGELARQGADGSLRAIGHRVVHGGARYQEPTCIDGDVLRELRALRALDPEHLPTEIGLVELARERWPALPQVACFDTAFHRQLPRVAQLLAIPRHYAEAGVRRYGFHGLSCAYLMRELRRVAGDEQARGRVLLAHLGAGSSLTAVRGGRPLDTTMGFTPASGVMMSTRAGDLDPGVLVYLMRHERLSLDDLDTLIHQRSGLLGVSETSPSLRDLLVREAGDSRAADAVALYCHQVKKAIGSLCAVLGGVDTLVFSGGIGQHAAAVRARVLQDLEPLGVALDAGRNARGAAVISSAASAWTVRVMATDEEIMIAEQTHEILRAQKARGTS